MFSTKQEQIALFQLMPQILPARQLRRSRTPFTLTAGNDQHQIATPNLFRLFRRQVLWKAGQDAGLLGAVTILFIARPSRQIDRPAIRPASAKVFNRATFDAKVVATTNPS